MIELKILLLVVCLCFSAFFSGMETGIVSVNRIRLFHLVRNGDRKANIIFAYINNPDKLLGTMLVGNNIVNVIISTVLSALAIDFARNSPYSVATALTVSSVVSTIALLIFGEFLPKAWFSSRPLSRCLPLASILRAIEWLLTPLSYIMLFITEHLLPGGKDDGASGKMVTREHLQWLARNSEASGLISPLESLMISRSLALQTKTARDVMTPMSKVCALKPDGTLGDVSKLAISTGHGKFPVIDSEANECKGILYVQDVLARISGNPEDKVIEFVREPFYINDSARADDLIHLLRHKGQRMAIVRNREGVMQGIITIDAIISIIVGNLPRDTTGDRKAEKPAVVFNASGKEV